MFSGGSVQIRWSPGGVLVQGTFVLQVSESIPEFVNLSGQFFTHLVLLLIKFQLVALESLLKGGARSGGVDRDVIIVGRKGNVRCSISSLFSSASK